MQRSASEHRTEIEAHAARFMFLDACKREFYSDWNKAANNSVTVLRAYVGRDPTTAASEARRRAIAGIHGRAVKTLAIAGFLN